MLVSSFESYIILSYVYSASIVAIEYTIYSVCNFELLGVVRFESLLTAISIGY